MEHEEFTRKLEAYAEKLNLTDQQIADMVGVSRPSVRRWIEGTNSPHPRMRRLVIDALHFHDMTREITKDS